MATFKVTYDAVYCDGVDDGGFGIHSKHEAEVEVQAQGDLKDAIREKLRQKHCDNPDFVNVYLNTVEQIG